MICRENHEMNIGDKWKDWTVESFIGEGTYGKVFKVVRNEFNRTYESALKVIRIPQNNAEYESVRNDGMDERSVTTYFRSLVDEIIGEFTMMSRLRGNSNIVSYEDHSVTALTDSFGWEICIRMELLTPLYKYLKDHELYESDVIKLGEDICRALEVCQHFNLIHRDIKPENIFVSALGDYKLGDFGIARQIEKTSSGMSKKGTYTYMAPEVYKGQPYDATVDLYSLGIVLYRFLNNNRAPFMPPYPESVTYMAREEANRKRMSGDPMPPPCNASQALADVIIKACAFDPKDRYSSPLEMRRALEAIDFSSREAGFIFAGGHMPTDPSMLPSYASSGERSVMSTQAASQNAAEETLAMTQPGDFSSVMIPQDDPFNAEEATLPMPLPELAESQENTFKEVNDAQDKTAQVQPGRKSNLKKALLAAAAVIVLAAGGFAFSWYHHQVPDVHGLDAAAAKSEIESAGLVYEESRDFSDSVERGAVIEQDTEAGSYTKKGSVIKVVISKGAAIPAPDFSGKSLKDAEAAAEKAGLKVEQSGEEFSDTVKKKHVISQDIEPGTDCEEGQVIKLVISKGKEQIKVPDVIGKGVDDATKELEKAGFSVNVIGVYSSSAVGTIVDQSVAGGESTDKGSEITISKSIGAKPAPKKKKKKKESGGGGSSYDDDWEDDWEDWDEDW